MSALVILDRGALRVHRRPTGSTVTIAAADAANRQPVWSSDGRLLAWSRFDRRSSDGLAKVIVVDIDGAPDTRTEFDVIFPAFYLHWRPDSAAIATLGEGPLGLELTVIDLATGQSEILARGGPLFFDWQANGTMLANVGRDDSRRFEFHGHGGAAVSFDAHAPAAFAAPARIPGTDGFVAAVRSGSTSELVVLGGDGSITQKLAPFNGYVRFVVSPDGGRVAWVVGRTVDDIALASASVATDHLVVQDLATGESTTVTERMPIVFEFSPDNRKLLYLSVDDLGGSRWMRWHVWHEDLTDQSLDWCRPSAVEAREYIPFSEQHARGQRRWSPDSTAFCYAGTATSGQEGVWVQRLDVDEASFVSAGQAAWWSPSPA
jgi:TolB protein